jgi:predicted Zn-dependent peptidase
VNTTRKRWAVSLQLSALLYISAATAHAQAKPAKLDRAVVPAAGKPVPLKVPTWTKTKLANGAELIVSPKRDLPLVSVTINFVGGTNQFEAADKTGLGSLTASMLSEGTTTKSGDQIAEAQQLLGTNIFANIGGESGSISFTALTDKLDAATELLADIMLNPSFPADALERQRAQRLVALTQAKDQPNAIANVVFNHVLYGDMHPYGRSTTDATIRSITRDDIVAFHKNYFQPGRAVITVVGDVDAAKVKATFDKAFANWASGGSRPQFSYPAVPASKATTIYLVDKPKAAQSVFAIGIPGPDRYTPDYYAISVMNNIVGGLFQSRINHLIREVKGYSYGVGSGFDFGRGPGAFRAGGGIITAKSDSALIDFMNELRGAQGEKPFTEDEIKQGKESLIQGLPRRFASVGQTNGAIASLYVQDLPENYFQEYAAKINAVTADDLVRVAKKYIDLSNLNIIIVGDRATIDEPLRKTGIAPIVYLDIEGKPVPAVP